MGHPPAKTRSRQPSSLSPIIYARFDKLKVGTGNTEGYRLAATASLDHLRALGLVQYENDRFGNTYVVDIPHLDTVRERGQVPVVHLGQVAGIHAVRRYPAKWLSVLLWCPRHASEVRLRARGATDVPERLAVWDATFDDVKGKGRPGSFDLAIRSDRSAPASIAERIHAAVVSDGPPTPHTAVLSIVE